ncbi:MAG: transglutaminase domain-containing protein, partial [Candidatus Enteromonas sp.]
MPLKLLPLVISSLLTLGVAPFAKGESTGNLAEQGYFESQLSSDYQVGFYRCLDAMVQSEEFLLGRMEYDVYPSIVKTKDIQDFLSGSPALLNDFGAAKEAYFLDHPAPFNVDVDAISLSIGQKGESYAVSIGTGRRDTYLVEGYDKNETETKSASEALSSAIAAIAEEGKGKSDLEKARLAAERLVDKATYGFAEHDPEKSPFIRSPYGALVLGEAVCEGYALAYKAILDEMGIPCVLVNGYLLSDEGNYEPHLWTDVKIEGQWYMVDPTLCDSLGIRRAFLLDLDDASVDHKEEGVVGASSFAFSYPSLSTNPYGQSALGVALTYEGESEKVFRADFSIDGKGAEELAKEGKYLAVSYSTQTSTKENIRWNPYASLSSMLALESPAVKDHGDSVSFYDWGSVPFLRFALINEPPTGANGSYESDLPSSVFLAKSEIIENEIYDGAIARPFANSVSPDNTKKLDILSRYTMEFTYDEPLEKVDKEQNIGIEVSTTHGLTDSDYFLSDQRFDEDSNTVRFAFRPSDSFLADGEVYSFLPTNLVSKETGEAPHPVTYSFAYSSVVCNKILPQGRLYMDVLAHPALIDEEDLSL